MKVLFINPSRVGQGNIPLNIPLLIGVLKKHNHEVRLFDMSDYAVFENRAYEDMFFKRADFNRDEVISDRKKIYKNELSMGGYGLKESDYTHDFEQLLTNFRPDIIAVSSLSVDFKFASNFILPFKEEYKVPVIFGGIHTRLVPEEALNSPACDFVCIGEGENSLPQLLSTIENKANLEAVKGIWFKEDGRIVKNLFMELTDLSILPIPDFECFDPIHFYRPFDGKRYKMVNYELSRGCPFNCTYCVNGVLKEQYRGLGPYHRIKKMEQSIKELEFLITKYNFNFVRFWDEDFTSINDKYLEEYAEAYLKKINLPFIIYARVDTVTEKKVKILKEMGCKGFAMGIESGNEFIRNKIMNRKISNETIIEKFNLVKSYGIRVSAYNIIGFPHETRGTIFDTIELNRIVNPHSFSVTLLEPYKGTPIRIICEENGLDHNCEIVYNQLHFIPKGMTHDELQGLYRTFPFYIRFPKEQYSEIKIAERDDLAYQKLRKEFEKFK